MTETNDQFDEEEDVYILLGDSGLGVNREFVEQKSAWQEITDRVMSWRIR